MPKESLNCPTCGGGDVTEFKADTYICSHCEVPFKWTPPPAPPPTVINQTIIKHGGSEARDCEPCKGLGRLVPPRFVCKFCSKPCCKQCMYHASTTSGQSRSYNVRDWANVPDTEEKRRLLKALEAVCQDFTRIDSTTTLRAPVGCETCGKKRFGPLEKALEDLLPRCGQCHRAYPMSSNTHNSTPFECKLCGTRVCKDGNCRYFGEHGYECKSCGDEYCKDHLVAASPFIDRDGSGREGNYRPWTCHLAKHTDLYSRTVLCHSCILVKSRQKRLLDQDGHSASGRAQAVKENRVLIARGQGQDRIEWSGHGLQAEFLLGSKKYQARAHHLSKNKKLISAFKKSEKRLSSVQWGLARRLVTISVWAKESPCSCSCLFLLLLGLLGFLYYMVV
ncbi:MAG: hypothetical protein JKY65_27110 [Planctomycetes bacterium]|nr:hypothetical protein [Planctomycetota bacterium]